MISGWEKVSHLVVVVSSFTILINTSNFHESEIQKNTSNDVPIILVQYAIDTLIDKGLIINELLKNIPYTIIYLHKKRNNNFKDPNN